MSEDKSQSKLVPAVERASALLDVITTTKRFLTVSELSRELGLPKSTVHGLCTTLVQLDLLIRRPDQTYILGPHILRWANAFDRQTDVATEFAALWDQMSLQPEATATLSVPENMEMVFIALRQSISPQRFPVRPGTRLPAAFCASGQAILAQSSDFDIRRAFSAGMPAALTERSPGSIASLLDVARETRQRGYALEEGQSYEGITSLGAPVLNALNRPLAAVMISLPTEAFVGEARATLASTIVAISERLSRRMGADLPLPALD
jgi:DNA-binding IclR family transcriptional regulator